ncbi:MAG TPA: Rmf/CrpP family protein [Burkholderiales bacterium]|nr:Rmf/CrpP family protein [Burkholderiales bacterium]
MYHRRDNGYRQPANIADEGASAYWNRTGERACPYTCAVMRAAWLRGYREAAEQFARN